jgi:hypothetical protein
MLAHSNFICNQKAFLVDQLLLDALDPHLDSSGHLSQALLTLDAQVAQLGLDLSFVDFREVADTNRRNRANWSFMMPMFDPYIADIDPGRMFCIGGRNGRGEIVVTAAAKRFDARQRSLSEIVDAGEFFDTRPEDDPHQWRTRMRCPAADRMHGVLGYCGGVWVHPDYRGHRLPGVLARIVNVVMLGTWSPDRILGFVRSEAAGTPYHHRYGFAHASRSMRIETHGRLLIDAVLVHMSADEALAEIGSYCDRLGPQIDAGVIARGREQTA